MKRSAREGRQGEREPRRHGVHGGTQRNFLIKLCEPPCYPCLRGEILREPMCPQCLRGKISQLIKK